MASGGTTALTRLPSGRRASTIGEASSTRRPMRETILSIVRRRWASSLNLAVDLLESALALEPDVERSVDHDLGDAVVAQVRLDRAVAEDVVGDLLGDPLPVRAGQRAVAGGHHVGERLANHRLELGRAQVRVVQLGPELDQQLLVHALLEVVEPSLARTSLLRRRCREPSERCRRLRGARRRVASWRAARGCWAGGQAERSSPATSRGRWRRVRRGRPPERSGAGARQGRRRVRPPPESVESRRVRRSFAAPRRSGRASRSEKLAHVPPQLLSSSTEDPALLVRRSIGVPPAWSAGVPSLISCSATSRACTSDLLTGCSGRLSTIGRPWLVALATASADGIAVATGILSRVSTLVGREPDLVVGPVEQQVPVALDQVEPVEGLDAPPSCSSPSARRAWRPGRTRRSRRRPAAPGRRRTARCPRRRSRSAGAGSGAPGGSGPARSGPCPRGASARPGSSSSRAGSAASRGGEVEVLLGADRLDDGVLRDQLQRDRHVAEGEVEVDDAHPRRAAAARARRRG